MPLCSISELLKDASKRKYALGTFVIADISLIKPTIEAAQEENSPVIVGGHYDFLKSPIGVKIFTNVIKTHAENVDVPVVLHLDHGKSLQEILNCIREGFNSVMFDAAGFPLEKNIELTKNMAKIVHATGIPIEAEINEIPVLEEASPTEVSDELMTRPEEAKRFVEKTKVDILGISVGQVHHFPKLIGGTHPIPKIGKLNFERIKAIKEATDVALCLHGSSHTPDDQIKKAIQLGVSKINWGTALATAFTDTIRKTLSDEPDIYMPNEVLEPSQSKVKELVKGRIKVFGSNGKA